MEISPDLKATLRRLKLSGILPVLPERLTLARKDKLAPEEFLELVLNDEIERRETKRVGDRLHAAGFEEDCALEQFDWSAPVRLDKAKVRDLFGLHFIERHENVIFTGPAGVGKTFLASALGHAACRVGHRVLFLRCDRMFKDLAASRADNSFDRELRRLLSPDLLVIDDFGLRSLASQACSDFYELVIERHRRAATIVTSNRAVEEWTALFAEPLLAQSALDRFCHNAHQLVIEGESYRERLGPGASGGEKRGSRTKGGT